MKRCPVVLAADFKQKSRWSSVWPNMHYGAMYLNYSVGRQMPMKGVNWVTRDSNRLTNFRERYGSVIADLDEKRNEEELQIPMSDIRWNDHRRVYWKCSFCGASYRKNVSVRIKYHAGCNMCKARHPSEVLKEQLAPVAPLSKENPKLAAQLNPENEKSANIATLGPTSKFQAEWKCRSCGECYRESIRSRTGRIEAGQCALHPQIKEWSAYCPNCRWKANLTQVGAAALKSGQYLGLESAEASAQDEGGKSTSLKALPRRRRLVV